MKKAAFILCLALTLTVLSGCWDSQELDTIFIVTGLGLDTAPAAGEVTVSAQIATVAGGGSGSASGGQDQGKQGGGSSIIMEATGDSVLASLERIRHKSARMLFLHHNQIIVFGRTLSQSGIQEHMDVFLRDEETRLETLVLVADGTAQEVLDASPNQDANSSMAATRLVAQHREISDVMSVNLLKLISKLISKTGAPAIPIVEVVKQGDKAELELSRMAVFKRDRMVGELKWEETLGYIWAMGNVHSGLLELPMAQGMAVMNIVDGKSEVTPALSPEGVPSLGLRLEVLLDLEEANGFGEVTMKELEPLLLEEAAKVIRRQTLACYQVTQQLDADIYGFWEYFHRTFPRQWKELEPRWDELYPRMPMEISIKAVLVGTGKTALTLDMEENKK